MSRSCTWCASYSSCLRKVLHIFVHKVFINWVYKFKYKWRMVAELILFLQLFTVRRFIYCDAFHTNVSSFSVTVVQTWIWVIGSPGQWVIRVIFHVRVTGSVLRTTVRFSVRHSWLVTPKRRYTGSQLAIACNSRRNAALLRTAV